MSKTPNTTTDTTVAGNNSNACVTVTNVSELTSEQYRKLYRLNHGDHGLMRPHLQDAYVNRGDSSRTSLRFRKNERVIVLSRDNIVLGWALLLLQRTSLRGKFRNIIHVYVRHSERKRNHAATIIRYVIDMMQGEPIHCRGNEKFFKKFGIRKART